MSCTTEEHKQHLCYLYTQGKTELVRALSSESEYVCGICHARAHTATNLCEPVQLYPRE